MRCVIYRKKTKVVIIILVLCLCFRNRAPINGTNKNCFFTRESFALYSVQPSFIGTLDLECSDGGSGGQLQTGQRNSVQNTGVVPTNQKSGAIIGKKTNTEATETSPKNQSTCNKKSSVQWLCYKSYLSFIWFLNIFPAFADIGNWSYLITKVEQVINTLSSSQFLAYLLTHLLASLTGLLTSLTDLSMVHYSSGGA